MTVDRPRALEFFRQMLFIRRFEEKCAEVYSAGKIRGFLHLYIGEEAVAVGALGALSADDNVIATYREHGHALVRGTPPGAVMAEMYGKSNGCSRGRGGSMHLFDASRRFFGGHAIVGGGLPIAVGLALADKRLGRNALTACFFGDGATAEGEFHESMNLASLWKLPVLFLCENNLYAMGTALERHQAVTDLCSKPHAHGIPAERIDGMDVLAVHAATCKAAAEVKETRTPRFLELATYRYRAHSMYDPDLYRTKEEIEAWMARDAIDAFKKWLMARGWIDEAMAAQIEKQVSDDVRSAVEEAEAGGLEPVERLTSDVYTEAQ